MSRNRSRSQRDDASNEEADLEAAEAMLSRLKKQYRMMERNRKQYYDESVVLLQKQRKMLHDLEKEKDRLEENLQLSVSTKNKSRDIRAKSAMSAILDRQKHYEDLIDDEKNKIKELDTNIATVEKQLRETRRKVPSTKHLEMDHEKAKISNIVLENRIQQGTVRLNSILSENSVLRNEIENLLKERDKFFLQARRLEKQLTLTTKKKSDIMDQVTKAYTEREEAQSKMRSLKERIDRDTMKYSNEMKKIQRAIDHQTNLRSFINTIAIGDEEEAFTKRQEGENLQEGSIELTLENYRSSISHLEEASEENSVDILVSNYLQTENDNYTLFSYISDLNNEVTALSGDIAHLQQEIDENQGKGSTAEKDNDLSLMKIKEELLKIGTEVTTLEEEGKRAKETLNGINEATSKLFRLLECDPKPVRGLIGGSEVTSSNLPVFLSVIEQKVKEVCETRERLLINEEELMSPGHDQNPDVANDGQTDTTPSSIAKAKPVIPHITHPGDDDGVIPTTHTDLLSSLRSKWSDSFDG